MSTSNWTFSCSHPDYLDALIDLSEFHTGASDQCHGKRTHNWKGGFKGRPGLLRDLFPAIRTYFHGRSKFQIRDIKSALRAFFRFLDSYEKLILLRSGQLLLIDRLYQISGAMLELFAQPGPDGAWEAANHGYIKTVRAIIVAAVEEHDLPRLYISRVQTRPPLAKDTPSDDDGLRLIRHLRREVASVFRRWRRADHLAAEGRNLFDLYRNVDAITLPGIVPTEADLHASYRALVEMTGKAFPSISDFYRELGLKAPDHKRIWRSHCASMLLDKHESRKTALTVRNAWTQCEIGLYPSSADVCTFALLCLARTAWNPATLLNLDVSKWNACYDDDYVWVFARKTKAGNELQHSISSRSQRTGVFQVLSRLLERNNSLRNWLKQELNNHPRRRLFARTPWIGIDKNPSRGVFSLDPRSTAPLNRWLTIHIRALNSSPGTKKEIGGISSSDFRDLAAAAMYRESRYSMWILMLMLGHKSIATTRSYGYRKSSRQESHLLISEVVEDVLEQIRSTKEWIPSVTRAKIEGIEVSPEARARLDEYRSRRTYSGAVCRDPTSPPPHIDPNHPGHGPALCIQGHLCIARACPRAVVLNDSLDDICKMVAELEWRSANSGIVRFSASSSVMDLSVLRETLQQWPEHEVSQRIRIWANRIHCGEHRPLIFAGQH